MNTTPTHAAIYRRVSTDHQDGSLELQERRVSDYCAFKGLITLPELAFSDPDTSGRTPMRERTGGRALMNRLSLGDIRHLVIAKLDRIGRNVREGLATLEFLKEHDIALHITDFGGETISTQGHMGRMILTVLLAVAEWEVEEIRDRTQKQMDAIFNAGELTGNVPFGYDCLYQFADGTTQLTAHALSKAELNGRIAVRKSLLVNHDEKHVLLYLAQMRAAGCAYNKIAESANARGFVTKLGRAWSTGSVSSVLESRHTKALLALTLQTSAGEQQEAA